MNLILDTGYGTNKYAYNKNEDFIYNKNISVFAKAPLEAEDMPLFEGKRYYIGEEALMEDSENIINITDYKQHEKLSPLSLWNVIKENNINVKDIDNIYIGISLAHKDYAKSFIKRMSKFKVNNEVFDFTDKIKLVAQGVGAKYAIDHYFYKKIDSPTYAIIDIGQLTIDVVTVIKGKVRYENAEGAAQEGVIKIIQQIQEYIAKEFSEIISIKEAQEVMLSGKYNLFGEHDLLEIIDNLKKEYSIYIINLLKQKYKNVFKKYPKIYFVGGGAYYISKDILSKTAGISQESIVIPEEAEYYNAIGGLVLSKKQ